MARLSNLARAFLMSLLGAAGSVQAQTGDDVAAWDRARAIGTEQAYRDFLNQYPNSPLAREAFSLMICEMLAEQGAAYDGRCVPEPLGEIAPLYDN